MAPITPNLTRTPLRRRRYNSAGAPIAAIFVAALVAYPDYCEASSTGTSAGKKLIEWGWDEPDAAFMRANVDSMDRMGFDGVVLHLTARRDGQVTVPTTAYWSPKRFQYADFEQSIADLRAARFTRLTENFIRFNVGEVDWFDDAAFSAVVANASLVARAARESGCRGWMLDLEAYGRPIWYYHGQVHDKTRTLAEYEAKVRERGAAFIKSVVAAYPDITLLLPLGYGVAVADPVQDPQWRYYWLLKPFLDGLFDGVASGTTIVDAYERAYPFRRLSQFREAYSEIHDTLAAASGAPQAYRRHVQAAFGVWMDLQWRDYGWHSDDFDGNYFTPEELSYALSSALLVSDKYVWLYTEQPQWWTHHRVPTSYRAALFSSRAPAADRDATIAWRLMRVVDPILPPTGYIDDATFSDLRSSYDFLETMPFTWKFRIDPGNDGLNGSWFTPSTDTTAWPPIQLGSFWDEQGVAHSGVAWYRLDWQPPSIPPGRDVVLWFGAVAEKATIWVNGTRVGAHDGTSRFGWDRRFSVDVSRALKPGQANTVVVRVATTTTPGGIWKSIRLAIRR
jgi:hypothetical protein